mgnify:CR=1 FL=1
MISPLRYSARSVRTMSTRRRTLGTTEYAVTKGKGVKPGVYEVSAEIEQWVSRLKLESLGVTIDTLTPEQVRYLASWQEGT